MTVNAEMLRRIADEIEAHPENYDQAHYRGCGTKCCIAGHAIRMLGREFANWSPFVLKGGGNVWDVAREALGLRGFCEADVLFHADWKPRGTVADALRAIANGTDVELVTDKAAWKAIYRDCYGAPDGDIEDDA